jgi:hypothetical protein
MVCGHKLVPWNAFLCGLEVMKVPMYLGESDNVTQTSSSTPKTPFFWKMLRLLFPIHDEWRRLRQPSALWDLRSPVDASIWFEASSIWLDFHQPIKHEEISKLSRSAHTFQECQTTY